MLALAPIGYYGPYPQYPYGFSLSIDVTILWLLEPRGGMGLHFRTRLNPRIHGIMIELMRREEFEQRGITTQTVHYIFPVLHTSLLPPPLALAQAPPRPPLALEEPQPPVSPGSLRFSQGVLLGNNPEGSGSVEILEDLPAKPEPIEISFGQEHAELEEEQEEEPEEGLSKDQEMGQQGMGKAGSPMSVTDSSSSSSSDSREEPEDELHSDYDPLWDWGGCEVPFLQSFFSFFSSSLILAFFIDRVVGWDNSILSPMSLVYRQIALLARLASSTFFRVHDIFKQQILTIVVAILLIRT